MCHVIIFHVHPSYHSPNRWYQPYEFKTDNWPHRDHIGIKKIHSSRQKATKNAILLFKNWTFFFLPMCTILPCGGIYSNDHFFAPLFLSVCGRCWYLLMASFCPCPFTRDWCPPPIFSSSSSSSSSSTTTTTTSSSLTLAGGTSSCILLLLQWIFFFIIIIYYYSKWCGGISKFLPTGSHLNTHTKKKYQWHRHTIPPTIPFHWQLPVPYEN